MTKVMVFFFYSPIFKSLINKNQIMKNLSILSLFAISIIFVACGGDGDGDIDKHLNESHGNLNAPTATAATGILDEGFTANWSNVSGATEYDIDIALDAGFSTMAQHHHAIGGNSTAIFNLDGNTEYYRLKAYSNGTNGSAYSNSIQVLTLPSPPVTKDASDILPFSFVANWEEMNGITTYLLYVSQSNFPSETPNNLPGYDGLEVTGTSHKVEGLEDFKVYYYVLKAKNSQGLSKESSSILVETPHE